MPELEARNNNTITSSPLDFLEAEVVVVVWWKSNPVGRAGAGTATSGTAGRSLTVVAVVEQEKHNMELVVLE